MRYPEELELESFVYVEYQMHSKKTSLALKKNQHMKTKPYMIGISNTLLISLYLRPDGQKEWKKFKSDLVKTLPIKKQNKKKTTEKTTNMKSQKQTLYPHLESQNHKGN